MAKILIIDDDLVNSQIYANKLIAENHQVILASDGVAALEKIKEAYDLILLDMMMPQINGLDVLKMIKKGVNSQAVILVLTNLLSEDIKKQCLENGAKEFLLKADYSPSSLLEKILGYLKGK